MAVVTVLDSIMQPKRRDIFVILSLQCLMFVLFGLFARYDDGTTKDTVYPMFQDVHVMIFVGFGFLMTFLRRYGFSAVGFNFLLASLMVQWAMLCYGFYKLDENNKIPVSISSLLKADIAAAAVLISMGAVLGQTSYVQLLIMGFIEIAVFCANLYLGTEIFKVADAGGSIFVHVMGAYFGLGVSYVLCRNKKGSEVQNSLEGSSYTSDLFAMVGTIFLWMFWPSFNAGELPEGDQRHRAVINTYLSLASCCVTAFAASAIFTPGHKFDMVHIQNSTLAGGVAVGTAANMMLEPYGAVAVGIVAGALSVFGYSVLTPIIDKKLNVHDTCGVHNLHGMPGVLAGLVGALMAGIATEDTYRNGLYAIFEARAPSTALIHDEGGRPIIGDDRSAGAQAGYQVLALAVTLVIAIIAGIITGFIILSPPISQIAPQNRYNDALSWHLPEEEGSHAVPLPECSVISTNGSSKQETQGVVTVEEC